MNINSLVIRTKNPLLLKEQYEQLGFQFKYHQYGNGPFHYASERNGFVFEIYPLSKSQNKADNSVRIGFVIENLKKKWII